MSGDSLGDLLRLVRAELQLDEPGARRLEDLIRARFGARQIYVARYRKRTLLEQLGEMPEELSDEDKARALGITLRRLYQLQSLRKG